MMRLFLLLSLLLPVFTVQAADVRIAYIEYDCSWTSSQVAKAALESKGYTVELIPVNDVTMWHAIANGNVDGTFSAWLPKTQQRYSERYADRVVDLGPHVTGARIGWVVPAYLPYRSIDDLRGSEKEFDGKIMGIDPTDGIMPLSEKAIAAYGLDLTLVPGSGDSVIQHLETAIRQQQSVLITAWAPHWMFNRWNLRYLDDPLDILSDSENIHAVVRKGLKEEDPYLYAFFDRFHFVNAQQLQDLMAQNTHDRLEAAQNARQFLEQNPGLVADWFAD